MDCDTFINNLINYNNDGIWYSWNVAATLCDLPYRTHTPYLDHVSGLLHMKHILKVEYRANAKYENPLKISEKK